MNIRFRRWTVPIALLLLSFVSFGLLIPTLGFYWDDWPSLLITKTQGAAGFQQFFSIDRPTTHISYVLLMPLLGTDPVRWQIFSLLLRWLSAVLLWWLAGLLWPDSKEMAAWAAVLFAVYPVFHQQAIALTYHQLWLQSAFYLFSLASMVAAVRQPSRSLAWLAASLCSLILNLLISEYFLGVELVRPLILWLAFSRTPINQRMHLKAVLIRWLPYLGTLVVYLSWRFLFLDLPGPDRNQPTMLLDLLASPVTTSLALIQMTLQDGIYILITNWYSTLQPQLFDLSQPFELVSLLAGFGTALACGFYLLSASRSSTNESRALIRDSLPALLLGLVIVAFGPLPGWITARQVTVGVWSDRLAVPAMFGASLAFAGLITWSIRHHMQKIVLISLLAGLATGSNIRVANEYRWARVQQNRFFWQLSWRAPAIEPQTALLAEAEVLPKTSLYSTAAAINLIYADPSHSGQLPYWFFSLSREYEHRMYALLDGSLLETSFRRFTFQSESSDSLIVYYQPGDADCLRFVTPRDSKDPDLASVVVQALPIIDLSRIQADPAQKHIPDTDIFGPEPEHGWCYLFQKADLARQYGNWQQISQLGDLAGDNGYSLENSQSNTPQEWLPFIEGYAHVDRWGEAVEISSAAVAKEPKMTGRICDLWNDIEAASPAASRPASVQDLLESLGCSP